MRRAMTLAIAMALAGSVLPAQQEEPPPSAAGTPAAAPAADPEEVEQALDDLDQEIGTLRQRLEQLQPGSLGFVATGWGFVGYADGDGETSSFTAGLNPIFLWRVSDRVFFEGEPEIELEGDETEVGLEFADVSVLLNDNLTLSGGLFLTPLGLFPERLHPAWINKLPDAPLPFGHDGLVPTSSLGLQLRGAAPVGPARVNYALFVSNGPRLITAEEDPEEAGMLGFRNFSDNNDDKTIGGRLGVMPLPGLEIGYGLLSGEVGERGTAAEGARARIQVADLSWLRDFAGLGGSIDVRSEWVWSRVDDVEGIPFENERDGGYAQVAFRPSRPSLGRLRNLEPVVRYDRLTFPAEAPEGGTQERWSFGLAYWLNASTAVKVAWQRRESTGGEETAAGAGDLEELLASETEEDEAARRSDGILFQLAIGF
jgi:hypothetical protein